MERYIAKHEKYFIFKGGKHHRSKYNNNLVFKWLNNGFMDCLLHFVRQSGSKAIFEVGCGEGQLIGMLKDNGYDVSGMDFDEEAVQMTYDNFKKVGWGGISITQGNIYDLNIDDYRVKGKMLICCEVLEHLSDPERAIQILTECTDDFFVCSVPHEPIWRILNFVRGKYMKDLGNTPGHINHWTAKEFIKTVSKYADVVAYSTPLPWTMVLARKRTCGAAIEGDTYGKMCGNNTSVK